VHLQLRAVGEKDLIDHRGRRRDQVEIELAAQALLNDLEVQEAEEPAAEAETERCARLHLPGEAGVVEAQLAHRLSKILKIGGVDRKKAAEDDRLNLAE